jgi:tetratricopeptide (TPR) repeat protein
MRTLLKRGFNEIKKAKVSGNFEQALEKVDELLQANPGSAALQVMRGELIQLQEDGPPLKEAKAALLAATELDEESVSALNELGHFEYAVEDDAAAAEQRFAKATALARDLLVEALLGRAATLTELGKSEQAFNCLAQARWVQTMEPATNANGGNRDQLLSRWESLLTAR